jgi:WD40 repeat protein
MCVCVCVCSSDADVRVWRLGRGTELTTLRGHKAGLCALQFDERQLVTASEDGTVRLWDYQNERELHAFYGHKAWVRCVHFTNNNTNNLWSGYDALSSTRTRPTLIISAPLTNSLSPYLTPRTQFFRQDSHPVGRASMRGCSHSR